MTKMTKLISQNRSGELLVPVGIVIHETATPGATAENEYRYFNSGIRGASAHGFVDWYGYIQTVPYDEVAWHAGYTANHKYIGIELCHAKNKEDFEKVWENALEVITEIFLHYGWDVNDKTLYSHNDISLKWHETDHTDPIGYFREYDKTVSDFRRELKNKINGGLTMTQYEELNEKIRKLQAKLDRINTFEYNYVDENMPEWAIEPVKKLIKKNYLNGDNSGLGLNYDMLRIITVLDRAGAFGE